MGLEAKLLITVQLAPSDVQEEGGFKSPGSTGVADCLRVTSWTALRIRNLGLC